MSIGPTERQASSPRQADVLEAEVVLLNGLRLPGVVRVLSFERTGDHATLTYDDADHQTLNHHDLQSATDLCPLGASLARTLAEMHRSGVSHQALSAETVLVDLEGRPLITNFSLAQPLPDDPAAAFQDLAALADLLTETVGRLPTDPSTQEQRQRKKLRHTCRVAKNDTATDLAIALADLSGVFAGQKPAHDPFRLRPNLPQNLTTVSRSLLGVTAIVLLVGAGLLLANRTATEPSSVWTPNDPTGPLVEHQGNQYQVGLSGDVATVGQWLVDGQCSPEPLLALLRPSTGEVFVFDQWAGHALLGTQVSATIDGAVGLKAETASDCQQLMAITDQSVIPVSLTTG